MPEGILIPSAQDVDSVLQQKQRQKFFDELKADIISKLTPNQVDSKFEYLKEMVRVWSDDKLKFNEFMERPIVDKFPSGFQSSDEFDATMEKGAIRSGTLGAIGSNNVLEAVSSLAFINSSTLDYASGGLGPLGNGSNVTLTSSINDTADPLRVMLAVCYMSVFHTSVSTANKIPTGSGVTPSQWRWGFWHDWWTNNNATASYNQFIENNTGGDKDIFWRMAWRYLGRPVR